MKNTSAGLCVPTQVGKIKMAINNGLFRVRIPLFLCLLLTTWSAEVFSQNASIDSIRTLLTLSTSAARQKPAETRAYCFRVLELVKTHHDKSAEAQALYLIGKTYQYQYVADSALHYLNQALDRYLDLKNDVAAGLCYSSIGAIHTLLQPNAVKAQEYLTMAMTLTQKDSLEHMRVINNVAILYNRNNRSDSAIALFEIVYDYGIRHRHTDLVTLSMGNLSVGYSLQENYQKATDLYLRTIEFMKTMKDYYGLSLTMLNLGKMYTRSHHPELALPVFEEAYGYIKANQYTLLECFYRSYRCELFLSIDKPAEAITEGLIAEKLGKANNFHGDDKFIFEWLSIAYQKTGNSQLALIYQKKLNHYNDSIASLERKDLIEKQTSDTDDDLFAAEYVWPIGLLTGAALVTAALALAFRYRKKKQYALTRLSSHSIKTKNFVEVIDDQGMKLLNIDQVAWFEKFGKHYMVYTTDEQQFRVKQTLDELEEILPPDQFFRINRAAIINLSYINNYSYWENRKYILRTKGEKQFTISSDRIKKLKEQFDIAQAS